MAGGAAALSTALNELDGVEIESINDQIFLAHAGGKLVVAQEADWAGIKRLLFRCHEAGIPAVLGNCPKGG